MIYDFHFSSNKKQNTGDSIQWSTFIALKSYRQMKRDVISLLVDSITVLTPERRKTTCLKSIQKLHSVEILFAFFQL